MRQALFLILLSTLAVKLYSQNDVTLILNLAPPYKPYIDEMVNFDGATLTCINKKNSTQEIYFKIEVTSSNGFSATTKSGYKPSSNQVVTLNSLETKVLMKSFLKDNFSTKILDISNADADAIALGLIPEGMYKICIQAFNFNTDEPVSTKVCKDIKINYNNTPTLTSPSCLGNTEVKSILINFNWSPIPATVAGANIVYDLYIIEVQEGMNAQDAMNEAIENNVGNLIKKENLTAPSHTYINMTNPDNPNLMLMKNGKTYAWMVVVRELNKKMVFTNQGKSNICSFVYTNTSNGPVPTSQSLPPVNNSNGINCSCLSPKATGPVMKNYTLNSGDKFFMGDFEFTIIEMIKQAGSEGVIEGRAKVNLPVINSGYIPVRLNFKDVTLNDDFKALSGTARALVNSSASFIPKSDDPKVPSLPLTPQMAKDMGGFFSNAKDQIVQAGKDWKNSIGLEMPIGIENNIGGKSIIIAITDLSFEVDRAYFNAMTGIDMPDGNPDVVALGAKNMCISPSKPCGEGVLYLAEDLNVKLGSQTIRLKSLKSSPSDTGTYVIFNQDGFQWFRVHAEYEPGSDKIVQRDGSPLKIGMAFTTKEWSNWIAEISLSNFKIKGIDDYVFLDAKGYYDHSEVQNPNSPFPSFYINNEPIAASPLWKGFFLNQLKLEMPPIFKKKGNKEPFVVGIQNFIYDDQGVTGEAIAQNIFKLGDAELKDWAYSLDEIKISFLKNAFHSGNLSGRVALPITDDAEKNQLVYNCLVNYNNSKFLYNFAVTPKNDIDIPVFIAKLDIDKSSNITISNNNPENAFEASAELNAKLGIVANLGPIKNVKLAGIQVQGLKVSSTAPYFTPGQIIMATASPDKSISGFPLSLSKLSLIEGPGLRVGGKMSLGDNTDKGISGELVMDILGKINGKKLAFDKTKINEIAIKGELSVLKVDGKIKWYDSDPIYGSGFVGGIKCFFPSISSGIDSRIQFGSVNDYKYWYVDALAKISPPIPAFPGTAIHGFGGGAYHHMSQSTFQPTSIAGFSTKNDNTSIGTSNSGVVYKPDINVGLGLKGTMIVGLTAKQIFNADVTLEANFEKDGGLNQISLNGNGRFLSNNEMTEGVATASINVIYSVPNKVFDLKANLELKKDPFLVTGDFGIYTQMQGEETKWNVIFGRPKQFGSPLTAEIAGFEALKAYFQAGNFKVDPMPPIPDWISKALNGFESNRQGYNSNNKTNPSIIFGASTGFSYGGKFLIFKGSLKAEAGFDFMLKKYDKDCNNKPLGPSTTFGLNGWYANGQVWAGIHGDLSVYVDLWVVSGEYKILDITAAAALKAGAPNPVWLKGAVGGSYSILDGLIEGNANYQFSLGSECTPSLPIEDPLDGITLLSDISPQPNENVDKPDAYTKEIQEITTVPSFSTNLKMKNSEFQIRDNQNKLYVFRFNSNCINPSITGNNLPQDFKLIQDKNNYGGAYYSNELLPSHTDIKFTLKAYLESCSDIITTVDVNGKQIYTGCKKWEKAKRQKDGSIFEETKSVSFKTGAGLDSIKEENIAFNMPYAGLKYATIDNYEASKMAVGGKLKLSNFEAPEGYENQAPARLKMRYIPMMSAKNTSNKSVEEFMTNLEYDDKRNITICGSAHPSFSKNLGQDITCQLIAEWGAENDNSDFMKGASSFTKFKTTNVLNSRFNTANVNTTEVNESKLKVAKNQRILYSWSYRTSQYYKSIQDKMNMMKQQEGAYARIPALPKYEDKVEICCQVSSADLAGPDQNLLQKVKTKCEKDKNWYTYLAYLQYNGIEAFNPTDVEGYFKKYSLIKTQSSNSSSTTYDPLVSLNDQAIQNSYAGWNNEIEDIAKKYGVELNQAVYGIKIPGARYWVSTKYLGLGSGNFNSNNFSSNINYSLSPNQNYHNQNYNFNNSSLEIYNISKGQSQRNVLFYIREFIQAKEKSEGVQTIGNQKLGQIWIKTKWLGRPGPDQFENAIGFLSEIQNRTKKGIDQGTTPSAKDLTIKYEDVSVQNFQVELGGSKNKMNKTFGF
ncbi:MAG: hypothetical protein JNL75_11355 [Chitinophagales bacterium]|nr:hypothetical protein [Chitinophagales bacterium]